jgi:hypothetical protein
MDFERNLQLNIHVIIGLNTFIISVGSPQITEHKKTKTFDVGNPGPGLGQAQKCGGDKTING